MSTRTWVLVCLCVGALLSGVCLIAVSQATVVPMAASGATVTGGGWFAFFASLIGTSGFSVAAIATAILQKVFPASHVSDQNVKDIVELSASFAAFMADRTNRAAQRRFVFALVDEAKSIPGIDTSHENGVIILKYSGYADPVAPQPGA